MCFLEQSLPFRSRYPEKLWTPQGPAQGPPVRPSSLQMPAVHLGAPRPVLPSPEQAACKTGTSPGPLAVLSNLLERLPGLRKCCAYRHSLIMKGACQDTPVKSHWGGLGGPQRPSVCPAPRGIMACHLPAHRRVPPGTPTEPCVWAVPGDPASTVRMGGIAGRGAQGSLEGNVEM